MLINNYSYINRVLGKQHSGLTSPIKAIKPASMRSYYSSDVYITENLNQNKRDSFPTGTNPPYSYVLGDKGALLSSTTIINGSGILTSGLSMGKACEASLNGTGTISTANLSLIVQLASSLSGSGTITTASLVGVVALASSLSGTGSLTSGLNVIAFMNTVLAGSGSVTANLKGTLSLEANIYVNQSEATVQQLIEGVWNALAINYNNAGTMGELLNNTGGGASPATIADAVWDEILSAHNIAGSTGEKLSKLLEKIQFLYLKD